MKRSRMPGIWKLRFVLTVAASSALGHDSLAAAAQPQPLVPTPTVNVCAKAALPATFTPAARLPGNAQPEFPESDGADQSEGWVRVGFTIDADGETKDVVTLDRIGSQAMARAARMAVARWKYKPATQDGQPVEQYGNVAELLFRWQNVGNTAVHDEVVAKFDEARGLMGSAKYAEGIAILNQTLQMPLTLYEQAKVSFALAFAYEKTKDTRRGLTHVRHALIENGTFLEKQVVPAARRMRMRLEAANGNLIHAACAAPLPAQDSFDPTGTDLRDTAAIIADAKSRLGAPAPLTLAAALLTDTATDDSGVWEHTLSRGKFRFTSPGSGVKTFRVNCTREASNADVNENGEWTVPKGAGPCTLRVYGDAGASFKLTEEW